jgi:single-strand DNA-binding protein
MANLNTVTLAGNLTRDPELKTLPNGSAVSNFGLAINRRWKSPEGDMREEATFVDIECWGRVAELVSQYLIKGNSCLIQGRLKFDSWEDKDGSRRSRLKVIAENVQFLDRKSTDDGHGGHADHDQSVAAAPSAPRGPAGAQNGTTRRGPAQAAARGNVLLEEPPF